MTVPTTLHNTPSYLQRRQHHTRYITNSICWNRWVFEDVCQHT